MADEDITLDGKPLQSLRVADLKAALEQRNLPKSGQKNTLVKRLKGALMLENLQKSSSSHSGLQPNSQIGEEMCQNSFIKQYLAKQQELLLQRLEREAQQGEDADESPAVQEEDEDHSEDNDSSSYTADKHRSMLSQPTLARPEERGGAAILGPGSALLHQESSEDARKQRANFLQGFNEATAPSPPRAVASLSVRVLGQPDRQGLPPTVPRAPEKEGTAPSEPGSAHPVLHLSRSAGGGGAAAGSHAQEDSDEGDDGDDESDDDEDWGPGPGGARRGNRAAAPPPQQMAPSVSSAAARSKRKLQPPQHIPPPQVHHTPMQLRHPTPPPSPPPNLFPLPDTPKQSPPDEPEGEGPNAGRGQRAASFPPPAMQRQDSDSSSRSSSPEPPVKRRPGPLSLLVHKMESEGAFGAAEAASAPGMSGEAAHSSGDPTQQGMKAKREVEEERRRQEEKERERRQELEREKKRLEEEREKERKRAEEERKQRQKEEQERERKRQEEEKERERKRLEEEKRRMEKRLKEEQARKPERANKVVVTISQDSGSSSDSDSKSDSSSRSSHSSSSAGDKKQTATQMKKAAQRGETEDQAKTSKGAEKRHLPTGEVSEPSAAAVTEVEPESEGSIAQQPASGAEPDSSEGRLEESTTPKAFAARKISLTSAKTSPGPADGGATEDSGTAAGRKRRWGSSTAVTAKKPSISITTDSLKSLIPDIKVNQEAVVDLHPEELQSSGEEENPETNRDDPDKGLKIRRTVTQVVPGDNQENGQTNEGEEEEEEEGEVEQTEREKQRRTSKDKRQNSVSEDVPETQPSVELDGDAKKITPSDSLVRRSISQQKSGVSVTIDDPVRAARQPSPPRGKLSKIIHVTNLVRPFTLGQLKELLSRTGCTLEDGFWIDKIKSHCFVTYATIEEAVATRAALHGVKWPTSNPKVLNVDFSEQDELDFHKGILKPEQEEELVPPPSGPPAARLPPLMPERDRERDRGVRDLWAEREREMERRERARGEREWDRDKVREFARPGEDGRRSRSRDRERRRRERAKSKERKSDKKEKGDEPPAKLLDDLFLKTKAAPCIYWLPLTEEQAAQRVLDRTERQKERERRRKEQEEEEDKKREEEKKERLKGREKEGGVSAGGGGGSNSGGAAAAATGGRGADADRERDRGRDRDRDREGDKRRDSSHHRSRRPSPGAGGGGRRSRSRSNPRDRRR